jgi:hypothetical protein
LVVGVVKLGFGLMKMTVDFVASLLGKPDAYRQDVDDVVTAVKNIPPGLKAVIDAWLERYQRATLQEQVLMGGELVGQIEAFIATFAFAGSKAGQSTNLTVRSPAPVTAIAQAPAPALTVVVPEALPRAATEGAIVSAQMVAASGQGPGAPPPPASGGKWPLAGATDAEIDKFVEEKMKPGGEMKPDGDRIELGPHGAGTKNRAARSQSGRDVQSAHTLPQSVGRGIAGYNADHALTRLMGRAEHAGMDLYWKQQFQAMRAAGKTQATAQEIFDIVAESIRRAPDVPAGEKSSLIARLSDEMFMDFELKQSDMLDIPYANIKSSP